MTTLHPKSASELTSHDYLRHPIWGYVENDDQLVEPVEFPDGFIPKGGGAVWIACEYELNDKSTVPGVVGIRLLNHTAYFLEFVRGDGTLLLLFTDAHRWNGVQPEEVAAVLGKTVDQVFPLRYATPYSSKNGRRIEGKYELE